MRTYTFPDADSTILSSNSTVTVGEGGTGATTLTGILKGNGTSAFSAVTAPSGTLVGDTDSQTLTNKTISKASNTLTGVAGSGANSDITSLSALSTALTVGQGGTGLSTLTANNLLVGNGTSALSFLAPGTSGNILQSNGTSWESAAGAGGGSMTTFVPDGLSIASTITGRATSSLTQRNIALFNIPLSITANEFTYYTNSVTTPGTMKFCIYTEDGSTKVMDLTTGTPAAGVNTITLGSPITFSPGNYFIAYGCATTCNNNITVFGAIASGMIITSSQVPSGENGYEGVVNHTSGTCNSTRGTITTSATRLPVFRLDN